MRACVCGGFNTSHQRVKDCKRFMWKTKLKFLKGLSVGDTQHRDCWLVGWLVAEFFLLESI